MERHTRSNAWRKIMAGAFPAIAAELMIGFALGFSPGWANCWPLGLTIHTVWSAGMSVVFFLLLMTTAVGSGAFVAATCSDFGVGRRRIRAVYVGWMICSLVLALLASRWAFGGLYASALGEWPGGYHPGGIDPC